MTLSRKIAWMRSVIFGYVFLLSLASLAQIAVGAILLWDHVTLNELVENSFWKPAAMLFGIGSGTLLIGWLGWNSTRKKNRCNLGLFCTLLLMSFVVQLYVAYWAHELRRSLLKSGSARFEYALEMSFHQFSQNQFEAGHIWNRVQEEYQCCGVDGHTDYRHGSATPHSCLHREGDSVVSLGQRDTRTVRVNQIGCLEVISNLMRQHLLYGALAALFSGIFQCVGSFLTLQLIMLLGRKPPSGPADPFKAATLRRHHLDADLQKPLAERRRAMEERKSPLASTQPKALAFGGGGGSGSGGNGGAQSQAYM